jgi:hypothetical protein
MTEVILGFETQAHDIPIDQLYPSREVNEGVIKQAKYLQIASSIEDVGIIEPIIVYRQGVNQYTILDGHIRYNILKSQNAEKAPCLLSTENEGYTYNKRVNRLTPVQEYKMIQKAIDRGVSKIRLAKALNVSIATVQRKQNMLDDICTEAIDIIKNKQIGQQTLYILKKMKPVRQVEVVELMMSMNNFSLSYGKALLIATPKELLKEGQNKKIHDKISPEKLAGMENELQQLEQSYRMAEETYGEDMLNFTVTQKYIAKLLKNRRIKQYLNRHQPDIYNELKEVVNIQLK